MPAPTVSVVLTAHNYGRFLDQCIRSVLAQTFQDFELVVVDDGSTDETPEILARFLGDPRVTVMTLSGVGLAAACNRGVRRSSGPYIMRLDADDFLDPHALSVQVSVLKRHPEVDLVYPDFYTVDEQGRFLGYTRLPQVQEGARLLDNNPLAGGALFRRTCFEALGGYNELLRYQEDFDFWLRFTERFRAYGVGLPLLFYRQHSGSMSRNRANRAAARRFVKRTYVDARDLLERELVTVVIPTRWPGAPERSEGLLWRQLGGANALAFVAEHAKACAGMDQVIVATEHPECRRLAQSVGVQVLSSPGNKVQTGDRPEVAWLQRFLHDLRGSGRPVPSLIVLASPYCPLRHPERLREAVDTLVIHGCDLVISVDSEPILPWKAGPEGLAPVMSDVEQLFGGRFVREAGELWAVRTTWLTERGSLAEARAGVVELLYPEWWCIRDEGTWGTCQGLMEGAGAARVQPSGYLRIEA